MMLNEIHSTSTKDYYDKAYSKYGFQAQRKYPNEELIRFFGRNFNHMDKAQKSEIKFLELGCGAGANLWPLAAEGFDVHGIEISNEGVELARAALENWGVEATVTEGSMLGTSYPNSMFDVVADVFSSYCLDEVEFKSKFLPEVFRILKPDGFFFSYSPSKNSMAYINHAPARKIDGSTINGILRATSPYRCNNHKCRFIYPDEYRSILVDMGFRVVELEVVTRTYNQMTELFEFVTIVARR